MTTTIKPTLPVPGHELTLQLPMYRSELLPLREDLHVQKLLGAMLFILNEKFIADREQANAEAQNLFDVAAIWQGYRRSNKTSTQPTIHQNYPGGNMSIFKFKQAIEQNPANPSVAEGIYPAAIVQVANIGLQRPFDKDKDPEPQMAVVFELENTELIAKRMKFSDHPSSTCFALFTSAFPDLDDESDDELDLRDLLGKNVLVEVEVRDSKWPRVVSILPLEESFESITAHTEQLIFDAAEMDREVYLKLHRDIRSWVSKRIRKQ